MYMFIDAHTHVCIIFIRTCICVCVACMALWNSEAYLFFVRHFHIGIFSNAVKCRVIYCVPRSLEILADNLV